MLVMPEGPSLIILKEAIAPFIGKKILKATGKAPIDMRRLEKRTIRDINTWGKHLLMEFDGFFIRIHLLMFGTWLIDEKKTTPLKLGLTFNSHTLNFYTCAITMTDGKTSDVYDWSADVMSRHWDEKKALAKLKAMPEALICDALMDQQIFSGVGNIIKNEILFNTRIHPESVVAKIPLAKKRALLREAVSYPFNFLKWKKEGTLKKHWLAYAKKKCPRCNIPLHKAYPGKAKRRSFFCNNCQVKYK
jgi:endonuclease VIII